MQVRLVGHGDWAAMVAMVVRRCWKFGKVKNDVTVAVIGL